jgi:hypothetical protein
MIKSRAAVLDGPYDTEVQLSNILHVIGDYSGNSWPDLLGEIGSVIGDSAHDVSALPRRLSQTSA